MKNQTIYGKGHSYEMLLRYAFKLNERSFKKGADSSIYETLFHIENGLTLLKGNSYEKQFAKIKTYLEKGFDALLKKNIFTSDEKMNLTILKSRLECAFTEPELESVIRITMDIVIPHKEVLAK